MRVALISTPFFGVPPAGYSGLEQVVWDLACALTELNQKVVVFAPGNRNPPKGFLYRTGEPINKVEVNWFDLERQAYERYRHTLQDFDIVHSNTWYHFAYLSKQSNSKLKICATHHGHLNFRTKPPGVDKMNLIAISRFMAEEYKSILKTDVRFVYNGINLDRYKFKKEKGDRLLFVGRISRLKRPDVAIEVARRVGMKLDVVGGTFVEDQGYVQQIRHLCEANGFGFHPDTPHEKKLELMQNARCLLFPSDMSEPFGLCPVEAGACGCPVVAWDDGAVKEVVANGVTGFVVPKTVESMAEAVKKTDSIKPADCRKRVEENFSREIMARNYLNVYEDIIKGDAW